MSPTLMAMASVKDDFLEKLLWTGVYGTKWPKRVHLIVSVEATDGEPIFTGRFINEAQEKHAEEVMLDDFSFLDAVKNDHDIQITLTLNYSPCSRCARKLIQFYENESHIKYFTIRFSHPYRINEEIHKTGLRNLNEAGVTLQAMNAELWGEVGIELKSLTPEDKEKIDERDNVTANNLNDVLSTTDAFVDDLFTSQFNNMLSLY